MHNPATIAEARQAVDLRDLIEAAGVELHPVGAGRLRGLCPFHSERTGSFFVFDNSRWHCFGCGEGGDAIDFVRRARGVSFREALQILGADCSRPTPSELARMRAERKRREALAWRERETARTLGVAIRLCYQALEQITPETLDQFALILDQLSIITYQHDILIYGDQADRAELVRELAGLRLFQRRLLFRQEFDYAAWLRGMGMPYGTGRDRKTTIEHRRMQRTAA